MAEGNRDYGLYDRAIRALTGARDWWSEQSDPNRPRKRNATDVNLPVETPPKPWYERIPTLESVGEQVGKAAVPSVKQTVKQAGGKVAGVLGASEESAGRAFGTLMDVTDPRLLKVSSQDTRSRSERLLTSVRNSSNARLLRV